MKFQKGQEISLIISYLPTILGHMSEYQLFVNRKEQICVMQSACEVSFGRKIMVYSSLLEASDACKLMYEINLDLLKYNMSRDESICIYTNGAFLAGMFSFLW